MLGTLPGNDSCIIYLFFSPTSLGLSTSTFTVDTNAGGPWTVALSGEGIVPFASISPATLSFPSQVVNTTSTVMQAQVTNTGPLPLTIAGFSVPLNSGYALSTAGTTCAEPVTLAAQTSTSDGGHCYVGVTFTPTATGIDNSNLTIYDNSGGSTGATQLVALSGTGVVLSLNPNTLAFPNTAVATPSASMSTTLTNTSSSALTLTSISLPGNTGFTIAAAGTTCTANLVLPALTGTCTVSVIFTPGAVGAVTGQLSVANNASVTPLTVALSGTGIASAATPIFSPAGGTYPSAQSVTISDATGGATIYYTTNGTTPTANSTPYTGAITVSSTETLEAIAIATGDANSAVASASYTIETPAATPIFSPVAGTYPSAQSVTISDATTGATIYYTTNGTAPTANSTPYAGAVTVSSTETIKAIAVATGYNNSTVATATYTIQPVAAPQAVLTPSTLTFTGTQVGTTSAIQTITLSNPGNAALSITSITYSGPSVFVESNNCGTTLAAGAFCTFSYTFTPTGTTAVSGGLSVVDNTENSPQTSTINGTGTAAPPAPDFTISGADASATVLPGGAATFNITGTPVNASAFPAAIMLTTSGLPTGATAIFSPASIASGAGTSLVTLTIQAPQTMAMAQPAGSPRGGTASRMAPFALALLLLPFAGTLRRHGKRFGRMLTLLLLLGAGATAVAGLMVAVPRAVS